MDVVLEKIHYNPDCFSKIVEDFEDYVERAEPGIFQKTFDYVKKSASFPEKNLIFAKINTKNMELAILELKNNPERFLNDFDKIKKILEGADGRAICTFFTTLLYMLYGRETRKDILQP